MNHYDVIAKDGRIFASVPGMCELAAIVRICNQAGENVPVAEVVQK